MRLERRLQAFNAARGALLDEMEALDPDRLEGKPHAGKSSTPASVCGYRPVR